MASKVFSAEEVARFIMQLPDDGDVSDENTSECSGDEGDVVEYRPTSSSDSSDSSDSDLESQPCTSTGRRGRGAQTCRRVV